MKNSTLVVKRLAWTFLFGILAFASASAQTGTIRGTITDDTGEGAIGANILVLDLGDGTATDFDGTYFIDLAVGSYDLEISYTGMATQTITGVEVKAGEVTVLDLTMQPESELIQEVVVEAKKMTNTDNAILKVQQKSVNVLDAVSAQSISRSGDGDAGEAIKRVTGVTVQDGKNVFVRGLGDRYTKTILNGMEIPGLDPDRNTVQMDIFPTSVMDNIIVYKTFSPNLSGDFTGGTVDITLKDFPDRKRMSFSGSLGYNPIANMNNNFLTYTSSKADLLGLGAASKALPIPSNAPILIPSFPGTDNQVVQDRARSFDKEMSADRAMSFLNSSLGFSIGNQINGDKRTYGYNFAVGYSNKYTYLEDAQYNFFIKNEDLSSSQLQRVEESVADIGTQEVLWSALASGSVKRGNNSYSLGVFHTQNGVKQSSLINTEEFLFTGAVQEKDILYYNQRNITNVTYKQRHAVPEKNLTFKISVAPTFAQNLEPDIRESVFVVEDGEYSLNIGDGARVARTYRSLEEYSINSKFDTEWKFKQWSGEDSKLKGGLAYLYKERAFDVILYRFDDAAGMDISITGDPQQIFEDENLFDASEGVGFWAKGNKSPSNSYVSDQQVISGYLMNEMPITKNFKAIYGLRLEQVIMHYNGVKQGSGSNPRPQDIFDNVTVLDELDFMPSLSLIYNLEENMNLRGSFSRTLVRPSFKEKSEAEIIDPVTGITFIGNIDLRQTYINNIDLRWEYFFNRGEMISLSGFYKQFSDPIEIVAFKQTTPQDVQPRNVDEATVVGAEFELKKNFAFISETLSDLSFGTNISYIYSRVNMTDAEYNGRVDFARVGEEVSRTRVMQGQSPYIINAYLNYSDKETGWEANISYNVQGERLAVVSSGRTADVYEQPFHALSFKVGKAFGKENRWRASLSGRNILNQDRLSLYREFGDVSEVYQLRTPGMSLSAGVSYSL